MPTPLSKSRYMSGRQCHKRLWYETNRRNEIPPPDEQTQAIFAQGDAVGAVAKRLFPGGIEVAPGDFYWDRIATRTRELLEARKPLYEAAFVHQGGAARVDLLVPAPDGAWDLLEVKSSTKVKEEHEYDVAFQTRVLRGSGLVLRDIELVHVDTAYVLDGGLDPHGFLARVRINDAVERRLPEIEPALQEFLEVAAQSAVPDIPIGPHCHSPHSCPLIPVCWAFLPQRPVTDLRGDGKQLRFRFLEQGIAALEEIPPDFTLSPKQAIQREAAIEGEPHVEPAQIRQFLATLEPPLQYLDFETVSPAIPVYQGTHPYQRVPFQFSLHVQRELGADTEHAGFLAQGTDDPRPEFLRHLREALLPEGSIVVYNAAFEKGVLRELAEAFPEEKEWIEPLEARIIDLLVPFRNLWYYHPDQAGSASIKYVLPAMTGNGYEELAINQGDAASREFLRITFDDVDPDERTRVRTDLERYCAQDTYGMVEILRELGRLAEP